MFSCLEDGFARKCFSHQIRQLPRRWPICKYQCFGWHVLLENALLHNIFQAIGRKVAWTFQVQTNAKLSFWHVPKCKSSIYPKRVAHCKFCFSLTQFLAKPNVWLNESIFIMLAKFDYLKPNLVASDQVSCCTKKMCQFLPATEKRGTYIEQDSHHVPCLVPLYASPYLPNLFGQHLINIFFFWGTL